MLVHWSDQILLRRTEITLPMRRHNHIVPAIQALRKHISLLVERYRKITLLRPSTPPLMRTVKPQQQSLSASVDSLSPFHLTSFSRVLPGYHALESFDQVDYAGKYGHETVS